MNDSGDEEHELWSQTAWVWIPALSFTGRTSLGFPFCIYKLEIIIVKTS